MLQVVEKLVQNASIEDTYARDNNAAVEEVPFGPISQPENPYNSVETEMTGVNIQTDEDGSEDAPSGILLRFNRFTGWR